MLLTFDLITTDTIKVSLLKVNFCHALCLLDKNLYCIVLEKRHDICYHKKHH